MKSYKNRSFLLKIFIVFSFMCLSHGGIALAGEPEDSNNRRIKSGALLVGGTMAVVASIYAIYKLLLGKEKERVAAYMSAELERELAEAAKGIVG